MRRLRLLVLLLVVLVGLPLALVLMSREQDASTAAPGADTSVEDASEPTAPGDEPVAATRVRITPPQQEPPRAVEPEPALAEEPAFVVRVVTEDDASPVVDVRVFDRTRFNAVLRTDVDGRVRFDAGELTSLAVKVEAPREKERTVELGETVVRVPRPVPLDVRFVDAETLDPLPAFSCWAGGGVLPEGAPNPPALRPLWPGEGYDFEIRLAECTGGTARPARSVLHRTGTLSRFATRAQLDVAIPRAARIVVQVTDEAGAPVEDAVVQVWSAATGSPHEVRTDARGEARPDAFPFHRGERVNVTARKGSRGGETQSLELDAADDERVVRLTLDREETEVIGISGGASGRFSSRDGRRREQPTGTGSLVVRVVLRDGRAAAGLPVGIHGPWSGGRSTDAAGVARFDALPGGRYTVTCGDVGMLLLRDDVVLADGEGGSISLVEARGAPLEVRVQDPLGRPLAGAELTLWDSGGRAWTPLAQDGTQPLAILTDAYGVARLPEAPPRARIRAVHGSRSGSAEADADGRAVVTVQ